MIKSYILSFESQHYKVLMILLLLTLFAIYWILFSFVALYFVKKAIKKYKNYPLFKADPKYYPFLRQDYGKWNQKELIKGCFLRSPMNFPFVVIYLTCYAVLTTFYKHLKFPTFSMVNWFRSFFGRIVMKIHFQVVEQFDSRQKITTPIVICNHTSSYDIIYTGSHLELLSFVAKSQVGKTPIISNLADFLNTLYVDRKDPESRHKIKLKIQERVDEFNKNPATAIPLLLFPQGTTTNGKALIQFKNGAFDPLCPVTIITMNYEADDFNPGMDQVYPPDYEFLLSSVRPKITVKKDVLSPQVGESVDSFRERCRKRMGEMTGNRLCEADVKDFLALEAIKKQKRKELRQQKSS